MASDDLAVFLRIVPSEQRTWQTFDDVRLADSRPRRNRRLARVLHGTLATLEPVLRHLNAPDIGAGVFICGHHTDGHGRRISNITHISGVTADLDYGLPSNFPLAPTLIVETSLNKFQAWWTLAGGETLSHQEHRDMQARLVANYGADPRACGIARVYRVPGFWHLKRTPFLVRITGGSLRPTDRSALLAAFPPLKPQTHMTLSTRCRPRTDFDTSPRALDRLHGPLRAIPADDYAIWIAIGLALHAETAGNAEGLAMWDAWSASSPKYSPGACVARWATFKPSSAHRATGGKIFWLATQHGWRHRRVWSESATVS
jgi:hypothetical protein